MITDPENEFAIDFFLNFWGALFRPSKIAKQAVFQAVLRGIGKSFQSAITAPRANLTGYGNATAQSWLYKTGIEFHSKTSLSSMWVVINISIPFFASAHVYNHFRPSLLYRQGCCSSKKLTAFILEWYTPQDKLGQGFFFVCLFGNYCF